MKRSCIAACFLAAFVGCAATYGVVRLQSTEAMTVGEAMELAGKNLTDAQRAIIVAAVRRQTLAAVRFMLEVEKADTRAGLEAGIGIVQLRDLIQ